jgi:hypothetical protein
MGKNSLLIWAVATGVALLLAQSAMAKTAKECTAEWRADKAGMQARGTTEKSYVEQCKTGASPPMATAPAPTVPTAPAQPNLATSKSEKECTAEWRADKAGMQARGVTERAYVARCKTGNVAASPSVAPATPTVSTPSAAPVPVPTAGSQKSAKDCVAEWRADKVGMQSRGVTEKAYVAQCRTGTTPPFASAPTPPPPAPAPTPSRTAAPAPTAPPVAEQQRAPAAPVTPSAPQASTKDGPSLEEGQFASEGQAKARCPTDTVVWVNLPSKVYHYAGTRSYGTTKRGAYMCEKEAVTAEDRPSKTESRPTP